jgi:hypothetical protein
MTNYGLEAWILAMEATLFGLMQWVLLTNAWGSYLFLAVILMVIFGGMCCLHLICLFSSLGGWTSNDQM